MGGYACLYDDGQPAVLLVTNLETGDVNALCFGHIPEYLRGIADAAEQAMTGEHAETADVAEQEQEDNGSGRPVEPPAAPPGDDAGAEAGGAHAEPQEATA